MARTDSTALPSTGGERRGRSGAEWPLRAAPGSQPGETLMNTASSRRTADWNQLFHLVTHGTHHRGQLLSMITLLGYPQPFEGGDYGGWSNPR